MYDRHALTIGHRPGYDPAVQEQPTADPRYKWIALSNTTIGVLMASLNSSILLIALPNIFTGIRLDPLLPGNTAYLLWLLLGYLLVTAVLVVSFGRIGDMYGRVRMYNMGFAIFTLFSILLSVTWLSGTAAADWLIAMRILQGIGGAFLMANSSAILTDAFPEDQRGLALGINAVAAIAGSFIGLILGGLLGPVQWRLVFVVSVPFGLFGTVWAYLKLRDVGDRAPASIDWWGNVSFGVGLILVLVAITYGIEPYGHSAMGWTNPKVLGALIAGILILVLFTWIETKVPDPMFRMPLFRIRAFSAGNFAGLLASLARGGLLFVLIIWLQGIWLPLHGYSFAVTPLWAGIYMLPLTAGFLIAGPASGYLSDRFGARPFATAGMIAAAVSFALLAVLPVDFAYPAFAGLLLLNGLGMGLFSSPNRAGIMNSLPREQRGAGSGMVMTFQNTGMVLSIGLFFTLIVIGLTGSLAAVTLRGLTAHGVPAAAAGRVAHQPPVGLLFAALLGYNPIRSLLAPTGILARLPARTVASLSSRSFFPSLIAHPFADGLRGAFAFSVAAAVVAAVASWLRGGKYYHVEEAPGRELPAAAPAPAPGPVPARIPRPARAPVPAGLSPDDLGEDLARQVGRWREQAIHAETPRLVVAISNAYGAGGTVLGPILADRLGLPFLDRAIPGEVAEELCRPVPAAVGHDDRSESGMERLISTMARGSALYGSGVLQRDDVLCDERIFQLATELVLWQMAAQTGGVVLGRAATVVLATHPGVLRVRLDGPVEQRISRAAAHDGLDLATARRMQIQTDRARDAYTHHFYGVHPGDPKLYDLMIDVSQFGHAASEEMIVLAAASRQR
jgi:MFS family permease/cytidylate kinase